MPLFPRQASPPTWKLRSAVRNELNGLRIASTSSTTAPMKRTLLIGSAAVLLLGIGTAFWLTHDASDLPPELENTLQLRDLPRPLWERRRGAIVRPGGGPPTANRA